MSPESVASNQAYPSSPKTQSALLQICYNANKKKLKMKFLRPGIMYKISKSQLPIFKVWAHMTLLAIFEALVGANAIWETTVLCINDRKVLFNTENQHAYRMQIGTILYENKLKQWRVKKYCNLYQTDDLGLVHLSPFLYGLIWTNRHQSGTCILVV